MRAPEISFGQQLRRLRPRRGLSQEALAERAGLTPRAVAALEGGGRRRPYPRTIHVLAEALGLAGHGRAEFSELAGGAADRAGRPDTSGLTESAPRLPVWLTSFVGRAADVRTIQALLDPMRSEVRLLSLVGPGGVGKTRLAVAAATVLTPLYPDGVVFVDLAPVRQPALVAATLAHVLEVRGAGGPPGETVIGSDRADVTGMQGRQSCAGPPGPRLGVNLSVQHCWDRSGHVQLLDMP